MTNLLDEVEVSQPIPARRTPKKPTRALPSLPLTETSDSTAQAFDTSSTTVHDTQTSSSPSSNTNANANELILTPIRAHYLKKTLISLQFKRELGALVDPPLTTPNVSAFSYLGPPFSSPPKQAPPLDLPFTRFIFRHFVLSFPFLAAAPKDFFPSKLQPFITSLLSRNLTLTDNPLRDPDEETEEHAQEKAVKKMEKHFGFLIGSAIRLIEKEEVVRLSQRDLKRVEDLALKRRGKAQRMKTVFEVNVVCVRSITEKGRVRSRAHEEFVIRTRRSNMPDIFVSRRYGDFRTLANELRKHHPEESVRPPPPKDRSTVSVPASSPTVNTHDAYYNHQTDSNDSLPTSPIPSALLGSGSTAAFRLARERNRLTLRSYLHFLMSNPTIASSPVLQSFLTASPITLTEGEKEDARRREEMDQVREEGRRRFAEEIAIKVEKLRGALKHVKGEMMVKNGLTSLFGVIKENPSIEELPPEYRAVLEWGRTSLAATLFQQFIASDSSSENMASVKRIHGLMPYILLKGILKISNPVGMIRGALDLFLAQPFGGRSLLQRMFTSSMVEEVKALQEDITAVEDKIEDQLICEKLKLFINAAPEIQAIYYQDAESEHMNILTCILRSGEEPVLNRAQMQRVLRAHRAHLQYMQHRETIDDSDDDDGPQNDDAWLYEDLKVLAKLYARLRDREQVISLIFEGSTSEVLKDILTIFYTPLAQVYKAASIADSIGDLQNFVNDLIRTVEQVEEFSQQDASRSVRAFLDLVERHQQSFYGFVHKVHTKGEALFSSLIKWIELFFTFIREGLGQSISLEYILPHSGSERTRIISEIDAVTLYHYKQKIAYEEKLQRRFGKEGEALNIDDRMASELLHGAVSNLEIDEVVQEEAGEIAGDSSEYYSSEEETGSSETEYGTDSYESGGEGSSRRPPPPVPSKSRPNDLRPARSMTFPHTAPVDRKNFELPPLPPGAVRNIENFRQKSPGSAGSTSHQSLTSVSRSRTTVVRNFSNPTRLGRRPSDSALHVKPPPPKQSPAKNRNSRLKNPGALEYPELTAIPQLLPLFVEINRPQLLNYR